jgi:exonuclease SbcD
VRLLHTSDWHLGRSFHRADLLGAQATFVDFLVDVVRAEAVDVVLVSGDLYDRALPPVDAVRLCDDALRRLAATGAHTVVISGNHDSARRLGFGADLLDRAAVHLRTDPARVGRPLLLDDADGPVAIYGVPYLEPDAVAADLGCAERGHAAVLGAAMAAIRSDLRSRERVRSVVLAHAWVPRSTGVRERARHQRRRRRGGALLGVPRSRLRRPGAPARRAGRHASGAVQRLAPRVLVLGGGARQGGAARRPRAWRSPYGPVSGMSGPPSPRSPAWRTR